jgi:excisionase family DNA binding protein
MEHADLCDLPPVLTVEEAAKVLRISRGSAYESVRAGGIPSIRIGRTIRVPRQALLSMLGEQENLAGEDAHRPLHTDGSQRERDGGRGEAEA